MKFLPVALLASLLVATPASADGVNSFERGANNSIVGRGRLDNSDYRTSNGRSYDIWPFSAEAGETLRIVVESTDFDSVVMLTTFEGETVNIIAENDDANSNTTNSQLDINVTRSSEFVLTVLAYDNSRLGNYSIGVYDRVPAQSTPAQAETSAQRSRRILEQAERLNRVMGGGAETNPNNPDWTP